MKIILKAILELICIAGIIMGFILLATETPDNATFGTLLRIYGGGALLLCISLALLSMLNKDNRKEIEQKGGKYYGI